MTPGTSVRPAKDSVWNRSPRPLRIHTFGEAIEHGPVGMPNRLHKNLWVSRIFRPFFALIGKA